MAKAVIAACPWATPLNVTGPASRRTRTRVLGLVLTDISNPFYSDVSAGATDAAARARGYEVFLAHTQESSEMLVNVTNANPARASIPSS